MPVLITGAGGFVGQHLHRLLQAAGQDVVASGHNTEMSLDFRLSDQVDSLVAHCRPERVYHLAATASITEMNRDPTAGNENIVRPAVNLMEALLKEAPKARLLLVSSAHVYGRPNRLPLTETEPLQPVDLYGAARAAVEYMVQSYRQRGLDVVIVRPFPHTGPGQDRRFAFGDWAARLAKGETRLPVGNLDLRRDYSDVRDIVAGYKLLAETAPKNSVYNLCSGQPQSLRELLSQLADGKATFEVDPARVRSREVPAIFGSAAAAQALGWSPRYSLAQTFSALLQWAMEQK